MAALTWNPSDKHADITLSNSNLDAVNSVGTTWRSARATAALPTSYRSYFEILLSSTGVNGMGGIADVTSDLTTHLGNTTGGTGGHGWVLHYSSGNKFNAGTSSAYLAAFVAGDILNVAFDPATGKLWFGQNGTWLGDPVAGTSPAFTVPTGTTYYAGMSSFDTTSASRIKSTAATTSYTAPTGFTPAGDPPTSPITGTASLTLATSASIRGIRQGTGTTSMSFATSGTLGSNLLSGTTSLALAANGSVVGVRQGTGTTSLSLSTSGNISYPVGMTGTTAFAISGSALLSARAPISGTTSLAFAVAGTLYGNRSAYFRTQWLNVYNARQTLLNKIADVLKTKADTAQTTATNAAADAAVANAALADIASDNLLTPGEKPTVILDYNVIINEQAGIDAKAVALGIATEKNTYDTAVAALTTYLGTLTSPTLWSDLTGKTTIVGSTFRTKFSDVYAARQVLLNKIAVQTLDQLPDGTTYVRPIATRCQNGVPIMPSAGRNFFPNSSFELNNVATPIGTPLADNAPASDGWKAYGNAGNQFVRSLAQDGVSVTGVNALKITLGNGAVIPASTTYSANFVTADRIPVRPSESWFVGAHFYWNSNYAIPAGVTIIIAAGVYFYTAAGAYISQITSSISNAQGYNNTGTVPLTVSGTAPANAAYALGVFDMSVVNSNGTSWTIPAGNNFPAILYCDGMFAYPKADLDNDTIDGTVYGRVDNQDLYMAGTRRIGMRVAGSNHRPGDLRNQHQLHVAGRIAKVPTTISYTAAAGTPATATISVPAFTILAGSASVAYNASSVSVTGTNGTTTTFYLYIDDPNFAGGAQTLGATTVATDIYTNNGRVYAGAADVVFPASGTGSGAPPGGGGSACVTVDMFLDDDYLAVEARVGRRIDCLDLPTGDGFFKRPIQAVRFADEECVRLRASNGAVLTCSFSTPFDLLSGETSYAEHMLHEIVVTDTGLATIIAVERIGIQTVARISVGGVAYAAGVDPRNRIYSHNTVKP